MENSPQTPKWKPHKNDKRIFTQLPICSQACPCNPLFFFSPFPTPLPPSPSPAPPMVVDDVDIETLACLNKDAESDGFRYVGRRTAGKSVLPDLRCLLSSLFPYGVYLISTTQLYGNRLVSGRIVCSGCQYRWRRLPYTCTRSATTPFWVYCRNFACLQPAQRKRSEHSDSWLLNCFSAGGTNNFFQTHAMNMMIASKNVKTLFSSWCRWATKRS